MMVAKIMKTMKSFIERDPAWYSLCRKLSDGLSQYDQTAGIVSNLLKIKHKELVKIQKEFKKFLKQASTTVLVSGITDSSRIQHLMDRNRRKLSSLNYLLYLKNQRSAGDKHFKKLSRNKGFYEKSYVEKTLKKLDFPDAQINQIVCWFEQAL